MKNYDKEKAELLNKIQEFLNSPELKAIIETSNKIQKEINKLPNSQFKHCDNFVNATNTFSNMMSWCSEFSWNRNLEMLNCIFEKEIERRKLRGI